MAERRTFYAVMERAPANYLIGIGGARRVDGSGKMYYEPYKEVRFADGRYVTDDPQVIALLEERAKNPSTGVTEDYEHYLKQILKPEKNAERLAAKVSHQAEEINRLKAQLQKQDEQDKKGRARASA